MSYLKTYENESRLVNLQEFIRTKLSEIDTEIVKQIEEKFNSINVKYLGKPLKEDYMFLKTLVSSAVSNDYSKIYFEMYKNKKSHQHGTANYKALQSKRLRERINAKKKALQDGGGAGHDS